MKDIPIFSVTANEIETFTKLTENAQLMLLAQGGREILDADKRLTESIQSAIKALRVVVDRSR